MKKLIPSLVLTVVVSHALSALEPLPATNSVAGSAGPKPAAVVKKKAAHAHSVSEAGAPAASAKKSKGARQSFHGVVKSTDTRAMTITIEDKGQTHVLRLDGESRLMKDGQPVHLAGIAVGDPAAGALREPKDGGSGEATVVNASFGQKAVAEAKPKSKSPGKSGSKSGKGHAKGAKAEKAAKAVKESESAAPAKAADVPAVVPGVTPLPVVPPAQ